MKKIISICLVLAMCMGVIGFGAGCEKKEKLYFYNWGDYMDMDVIHDFEKKYNVKVVMELFDTNEDMYIKVKNGSSPYDVIVPSEYMVERLIRENLLLELNLDNIPNYSNISKSVLDMRTGFDDKYAVPFMWGTLGILYNTETVDAEEAKSWDILWNEKYKKKIVMINSIRDSMAVALIKLGYSLNTRDEKEINEATELLIQQLPLQLSYETDEIKRMIADGTADVAVTYSGEAVTAKAMGAENGRKLDFVVPEEGSNAWYDALVIPKTSKNKELAEKFINFLCEAENAKRISEYIGYATANEAALKLIDEELTGDEDFWATDDIIKRCTVFQYLGADIEKYEAGWIRVQE